MELISPREVKKILGISRSTLDKFTSSGILLKYTVTGMKYAKYDKKQVLELACQVKNSD